MGLFKNFEMPWPERSTLQFRLESFNTFNHSQWKIVNAGCCSAILPGASCSGAENIGNDKVASDWGARISQLSIKFTF